MKDDYMFDEINARVKETGDFKEISSKIEIKSTKNIDERVKKIKFPFYLKLTGALATFVIIATSTYFLLGNRIISDNNPENSSLIEGSNSKDVTDNETHAPSGNASDNGDTDYVPGASGSQQLYEGMSVESFVDAINNLKHLNFYEYYFVTDGKFNYVAKENVNTNKIAKLFKCKISSVNDDSFAKLANGATIYETVETIGVPAFIGLEENLSLDFTSEDFLYRINLSNENDSLVIEDKIILNRNDPKSWFDVNKSALPNEEDVDKISLGMSLDDVVTILGKPQRDIGYGTFLLEFDLSNGKKLVAQFTRIDTYSNYLLLTGYYIDD